MPVIPNAGGFSKDLFDKPVPTLAERKVVINKGNHGWAGKAKIALEPLEIIIEYLEDYRLVIYAAHRGTIKFAKQIADRTGLKITAHCRGNSATLKFSSFFPARRCV
jgi:hypothetical protein